MRRAALGVIGSGLFVLGVLPAQACGADPDTPPESDASIDASVDASIDVAMGEASRPSGECTTDEACIAKLPVTTPENCAIATCDRLLQKCHFQAKDVDGDGHPAKACSAASVTIETGDDCDDTDPNSYPGAWDGPATDFDAGPGAQSDRCDQRDNDCNGSPDDGRLEVDGGQKTCRCDPNKPLPCYEYPSGLPIDPSTLDLENRPKGICRKGTRTCVGGVPSTCSGAVGPASAEQCDTLDHDCDGRSGNDGDTVTTAPLWYKDADNDNYGDLGTVPLQQCSAPPGLWKQLVPNTDCDDNDAQKNPGRTEVCDGKDNNCNGNVDEGVKTTFCADADGDGYCTASCIQACTAPLGFREQTSCAPGTDCDDSPGGASIYPGATELCGDGLNSNCSGDGQDSETYPNLGQTCSTVGNYGVCRRTGTYVCTTPARTSTTCNATAGTAGAASASPSSDPLIDMSQARSNYDPRWDHDCSNDVTVVPTLHGGNFRYWACIGNYAAACEQFADPTSCNAGPFRKNFNCEKDATNNYFDPTSSALCGRNMSRIGCIWVEPNPGNGRCLKGEDLGSAGVITCR